MMRIVIPLGICLILFDLSLFASEVSKIGAECFKRKTENMKLSLKELETKYKAKVFGQRFKIGTTYTGNSKDGQIAFYRVEYLTEGTTKFKNSDPEVLTIEIGRTQVKLRSESYKIDGQNFVLEKTGEGLNRVDIASIDSEVLSQFDPSRHKKVVVKFLDEKLEVISKTQREQNIAHQKVINLYKETKGGYLKDGDLEVLKNVDADLPNQTVFNLVKKRNKGAIERSSAQFHDDLMATITVAYSEKNVYDPSFAFPDQKVAAEYLPMFRRLYTMSPKERKKIWLESIEKYGQKFIGREKILEELKKLYDGNPKDFRSTSPHINTGAKLSRLLRKKFGEGKKYAEFIRFSKFEDVSSKFPKRVFLNALIEAKKEGVDVILANADLVTSRIATKDYGYRKLATIDTRRFHPMLEDEIIMPERVLYIKVNDPQYDELVKKLKRKIGDNK